MKRALVTSLLFVVIGIQAVRPNRVNPPVDASRRLESGPVPAPVAALLRRACYDCHSNETRWPWYAYVAPVSWLVAGDVKDGRKELNFSDWGDYSAAKRSSKADSMAEEVEKGDMPLPKYLRIHHDARLSREDVVALRAWADSLD
jgi:hypothetical protein